MGVSYKLVFVNCNVCHDSFFFFLSSKFAHMSKRRRRKSTKIKKEEMFRYIKTTFSKPFKTTLTKIKIVGKYKLNAPSLEQVN